MTPVGIFSILLFLGALIAVLRGWIPQRIVTLQTVLLLVAFGILLLRLVAGPKVHWSEIYTATSLHPITSTIAGFLFAGALQAAGAFEAAGRMIGRLVQTSLGLPFAIVLLVNLPTIFAMPCGRILAAPLMPLAMLLGFAVARKQNDPAMVAMVVFGFLVNAGASCAPSLIGGLELLGEGMGRFPTGVFAKPNQMAILAMTVFTMASIRLYYKNTLSMRISEPHEKEEQRIPEQGYFAFLLFVVVLIIVVVIRPQIPIQTVLTLMTLLVMLIAKLSLHDVLGGVMLHPLSALTAGYIVAGALLVAGGFDVLEAALSFLAAHTFLGYVGVSVLIIFLPLFFAMPCGRIIAVSLIPGVLMFGQRVAEVTGFSLAPAVLLGSFIVCSAASCGPSPLGGVGNIGEGRLRIRGSWSTRPQAVGIFLGVPVSALLIPVHGIGSATLNHHFALIMLCAGAVTGSATNLLFGYKAHHVGGLLGGVAVGALTVAL